MRLIRSEFGVVRQDFHIKRAPTNLQCEPLLRDCAGINLFMLLTNVDLDSRVSNFGGI